MTLKKMKLSDCCMSISDGDHQPPPKATKGIPFVTIANINGNNKFDFSNTMYVPKTYYDSLDSKRRVQNGDILYSVVGSFGIPVYISDDTPFVFQRHIAILRPDKDKAVSKYLYYVMLSRDFYSKADAVAIGAAQRTVSLTALRNMEIELPDFEIQERIANILSNYDDLIENNQKQIKLLEEAAQRLYKEWFVELRFPGYEDMEIVDGVPKGWSITPIENFIEFQNGYAFKSDAFDNDGKYKIVTIKNVQDGYFEGNKVNRIVDIPDKMPEHCRLCEGDVLLSLTGNIGRICSVIGENYLLNQRVAKIKSEYQVYAYYLFKNEKMFHDLNNLANGAAQQNLSPIRAGKICTLKPSEKIMYDFEKMIKPLFAKKILLSKEIISLKNGRDTLLPKLLNGEIEV